MIGTTFPFFMNIIQVYKRFPTQDSCVAHLEKVRWEGKPKCPYCKSLNSTPMPKQKRHHCNACNTSYSVTVATIFHKTKIDLQKWFLAIALILNAKKGISARQLSRDLEVNKNTAWFLAMRIRRAMLQDFKLLSGIVEMDETYVGGKPRKGSGKRGRGTKKTPVVGMIERGGRVKARTAKNVTAKVLTSLVRENVEVALSTMMTDEFKGYSRLGAIVTHKSVNHSKAYVDGDVHTNGIEGFWALLKRGIVGQYHKVSARHLPRYIDEFCFRYNNRENANVFDVLLLKSLPN